MVDSKLDLFCYQLLVTVAQSTTSWVLQPPVSLQVYWHWSFLKYSPFLRGVVFVGRKIPSRPFPSCLPPYIWALSNLTLSVRKSISYIDQNLILGTRHLPADIDDINIDEDGEIRKQSYNFYILGYLLIFSIVHLCSWCYFNFLKNDHMGHFTVMWHLRGGVQIFFIFFFDKFPPQQSLVCEK